MNKVILMGRLTRDPELRSTSSQTSYCSFTLAVDRRFKSANGERQTDFINCTAWRQTAEFVSRYFRQGSRLVLVGSIQTSSWEDQEGKRQYRTDVLADEVYFADSKQREGSDYGAESYQPNYPAQPVAKKASPAKAAPAFQDAFLNDDDDDVVLPFDV